MRFHLVKCSYCMEMDLKEDQCFKTASIERAFLDYGEKIKYMYLCITITYDLKWNTQ